MLLHFVAKSNYRTKREQNGFLYSQIEFIIFKTSITKALFIAMSSFTLFA
jgi:hypothetical protein